MVEVGSTDSPWRNIGGLGATGSEQSLSQINDRDSVKTEYRIRLIGIQPFFDYDDYDLINVFVLILTTKYSLPLYAKYTHS